MEEISPFIKLLSIDIATILAVTAWILFVISFLKSQFSSLKGNWTIIFNLGLSAGTLFAIMYKTGVFDLVSFIFSTLICTIASAGGKELLKQLASKVGNGEN